jgi:hypothetical protein
MGPSWWPPLEGPRRALRDRLVRQARRACAERQAGVALAMLMPRLAVMIALAAPAAAHSWFTPIAVAGP